MKSKNGLSSYIYFFENFATSENVFNYKPEKLTVSTFIKSGLNFEDLFHTRMNQVSYDFFINHILEFHWYKAFIKLYQPMMTSVSMDVSRCCYVSLEKDCIIFQKKSTKLLRKNK